MIGIKAIAEQLQVSLSTQCEKVTAAYATAEGKGEKL